MCQKDSQNVVFLQLFFFRVRLLFFFFKCVCVIGIKVAPLYEFLVFRQKQDAVPSEPAQDGGNFKAYTYLVCGEYKYG